MLQFAKKHFRLLKLARFMLFFNFKENSNLLVGSNDFDL